MNSIIISQNISVSGEVWYSALISNDIPQNQSVIESKIGSISTFSIYREISNNQLLDFEYAHKVNQIFSGDSITNKKELNLFNNRLTYNNRFGEPYRLWLRYSDEKFETRLGLQKIIFGPSKVLRSLSWFDNVDLTDPTGQIKGVKALLTKWFPSNTISIWAWSILNQTNNLSFGIRSELSGSSGEWGLNYHKDQYSNIGLDYRYDGYVGFWSESSLLLSENINQTVSTLGLDYTLPILNGLYLMAELMSSKKNKPINSSDQFAAFMVNMPFGINHQVSLISNIKLNDKKKYHFLRINSAYNKFSVNYILSINPKRNDYLPVQMPNSLESFGKTIQIMLIYNY